MGENTAVLKLLFRNIPFMAFIIDGFVDIENDSTKTNYIH